MPLKNLTCDFTANRDLEILRGINTIEKINGKPAGEFLKEAAAAQAAFEQWIKDTQKLPAEKQTEAVAKKLQERNPGFDGKLEQTIENGAVTELRFLTDKVVDISPVQALRGLKVLHVLTSDLSVKSEFSDLAPLRGMRMTHLSCGRSKVADLASLQAMPLVSLDCANSNVVDLSPLRGMSLQVLRCHGTGVSDLTPLKGMPLITVNCSITKVADLSPLKGMPLTVLGCRYTGVTDLALLKDMPLEVLTCDFVPERDAATIRAIKKLTMINGKPAAEFWKEVDAKKP
jgi:hypothetical protein